MTTSNKIKLDELSAEANNEANKLIDCVKYLNSFDTLDKLVDSNEAFSKITTIETSVSFVLDKKYIYSKLLPYKFNDLISNLLAYLSDKINSNFDYHIVKCFKKSQQTEQTNSNERQLFILSSIFSILNDLLPICVNFGLYFNSSESRLDPFFKLLKNDRYINFMRSNDSASLGSLVYDLNWMSKCSASFKFNWKSLNAVETLFELNKKCPNYKIDLYMIISNVATDTEIEKYPEIHESVDEFARLTIDCINNPYTRIKVEFNDEESNTNQEFEVLFTKSLICINGLLLSLYQLSINDKLKEEIFNKPGLKQALIKLVYEGNDIERQNVIQLLTQLSFESGVRKSLANEKELIGFVEELLRKNVFVYLKLKSSCESFLWNLRKDEGKSLLGSNFNFNNKHIMISYNTGSRELCLKIKEQLEKSKLKVWIDVSEIHGSSLDSMAKAVENAEIVLICVTEKYRQSINCQSEAQYSFRLQKKIIPLIMQKGYQAVDGWLGFIIGDKIFIDFTKYEFEECVNRLLNQMSKMNVTNEENSFGFTKNRLNLSDHESRENKQISESENWDEGKVEKWFVEKDIHKSIFEMFKPLDGVTLFQLYQLQMHTPEFFYKSLAKSESIDLKQAAHFGGCLKKLFYKF